MIRLMHLVVLMILLLFPVESLGGGKLFKAATNSAKKRITAKMLRQEALRDKALPVKALAKPREVFRYASNKKDLASGVKAGRHMTVKAGSGRPLSAAKAQQRYGLPKEPKYRETVSLPQGHPVREGKVKYGERGYGELTSPRDLGKEHVTNVITLH